MFLHLRFDWQRSLKYFHFFFCNGTWPRRRIKSRKEKKINSHFFCIFWGNVVTFWATFGLKADICCVESLNFGGLSLCSSAKGVNPPYLQLFYVAREAIKWRMHGSQRWLLGQWIDFSACLCGCPFVCKQVSAAACLSVFECVLSPSDRSHVLGFALYDISSWRES